MEIRTDLHGKISQNSHSILEKAESAFNDADTILAADSVEAYGLVQGCKGQTSSVRSFLASDHGSV
jgi:hypothetical protein